MITCGNCKGKHNTANEVRSCYSGIGSTMTKTDIPEFVSNPASDKQLEFIRSLMETRDHSAIDVGRTMEILMDVMDNKAISKSEASQAITELKACPPRDPCPTVPEGKYATRAADGHVVFWVIDKPTQGKWAGHVFIKQLLGGVGEWRTQHVNHNVSDAALEKIKEDPVKAASLFGYKAGICGRCMSPLSNLRSRAAGYGHHCAEVAGWPYPSEEDARRILQEMEEAPEWTI